MASIYLCADLVPVWIEVFSLRYTTKILSLRIISTPVWDCKVLNFFLLLRDHTYHLILKTSNPQIIREEIAY